MNDFIAKYKNHKNYKEEWGDNPRVLLDKYDYQIELTRKLDAIKPEDLDVEMFYEIVLWKLNRFPSIPDGLLDELKKISALQPKQHREAEGVLHKMLRSPGIALPMASTILRFLKPKVFQIIDDRVYRIVNPGEAKYPTKPQKVNEQYLNNSSSIYFKYLDDLHNLSSTNLPFEDADRILYQFDKELGNKIGDKS